MARRSRSGSGGHGRLTQIEETRGPLETGIGIEAKLSLTIPNSKPTVDTLLDYRTPHIVINYTLPNERIWSAQSILWNIQGKEGLWLCHLEYSSYCN